MLFIGYGEGDYEGSVIQNLVLPASVKDMEDEDIPGLSIVWSSSNGGIISNSGAVSRPAGNANAKVKLTAVISRGSASLSKEFEVTVIREKNIDYNQIPDNSAEDIAAMNQGSTCEIIYSADSGQAISISGKFSNITVECLEDAIASICGVRGLIGLASPVDELAWAVTNNDEYGVTYTFGQVCEGTEVYGRTVTIAVDINGVPLRLNSGVLISEYLQLGSWTLNVSCEQAVAVVMAAIMGDLDVLASRQIIYSFNDNELAPVLAHCLDIVSVDGEESYVCGRVVICALTGDILSSNLETYPFSSNVPAALSTETSMSAEGAAFSKDQCIHEYALPKGYGCGYTEHNTHVTFPVRVGGIWPFNTYYMQESIRNIQMYEYVPGSGIFSSAKEEPIKYSRNTWSNESDKSAVSAYSNIIYVYDWFAGRFGGHRGMDGKGGRVNIVVNDRRNASAERSGNSIRFSDVAGDKGITFAGSLGVAAHEYAHGVFSSIAGDRWRSEDLIYQKFFESKLPVTISEGYADIFEALVTYNVYNAVEDRWVAIADIYTNKPLWRDMKDPNSSNNPAKIGDAYFQTGHNIDAHINSTILSHAAYLMVEKYGLPLEQVEKLWYYSMRYGYDNTSDFYTVFMNVMTSARDNLRFSTAAQIIIANAFGDVFGNNGYFYCTVYDKTDIENANIIAQVSIYDSAGNLVKSDSTRTDGSFGMYLEAGSYTYKVTKDGYSDASGAFNIVRVGRAPLKIGLVKGSGNASGAVIGRRDSNAARSAGMASPYGAAEDTLTGVTVNVRAGFDAKSGDIAQTVYTDAEGKYSFSGNAGNYTAEFVKSGYKTTWKNVVVRAGEVPNQDVTMYADETINIHPGILDWGYTRYGDTIVVNATIKSTHTATAYIGFAAIGYNANNEIVEIRHNGPTGVVQPGFTNRYSITLSAGSQITRVGVMYLLNGLNNTPGSVDLLASGWHLDELGRVVVTGVVSKGTGVSNQIGFVAVGYNEKNVGVEVGIYRTSNHGAYIASGAVILSAGSQITKVEILPIGNVETGTVELLGSGYYLQNDGSIRVTGVTANGTNTTSRISILAIGYNANNEAVEVGSAVYSSNQISRDSLTLSAGSQITRVEVLPILESVQTGFPELLASGFRYENGRVIVTGVVVNSRAMVVTGYNVNNEAIEANFGASGGVMALTNYSVSLSAASQISRVQVNPVGNIESSDSSTIIASGYWFDSVSNRVRISAVVAGSTNGGYMAIGYNANNDAIEVGNINFSYIITNYMAVGTVSLTAGSLIKRVEIIPRYNIEAGSLELLSGYHY
jgi:Zn-dependent metalloprotease